MKKNPSGAIKDEPVNKVDNMKQDVNSPLNRKRLEQAKSHKSGTYVILSVN